MEKKKSISSRRKKPVTGFDYAPWQSDKAFIEAAASGEKKASGVPLPRKAIEKHAKKKNIKIGVLYPDQEVKKKFWTEDKLKEHHNTLEEELSEDPEDNQNYMPIVYTPGQEWRARTAGYMHRGEAGGFEDPGIKGLTGKGDWQHFTSAKPENQYVFSRMLGYGRRRSIELQREKFDTEKLFPPSVRNDPVAKEEWKQTPGFKKDMEKYGRHNFHPAISKGEHKYQRMKKEAKEKFPENNKD